MRYHGSASVIASSKEPIADDGEEATLGVGSHHLLERDVLLLEPPQQRQSVPGTFCFGVVQPGRDPRADA